MRLKYKKLYFKIGGSILDHLYKKKQNFLIMLLDIFISTGPWSFIRLNTMNFITLAFYSLQWIGIFSSSNPSRSILWILNVYRGVILIGIGFITCLMTIQIFLATDLTILARTIDIWTMFLSGLYKWFYMTVFNKKFAKLNSALVQIQAQGTVAYGQTADLFTANYLKLTQKVTFWYIFSGMVAVFFIIISPLLTYPKR